MDNLDNNLDKKLNNKSDNKSNKKSNRRENRQVNIRFYLPEDKEILNNLLEVSQSTNTNIQTVIKKCLNKKLEKIVKVKYTNEVKIPNEFYEHLNKLIEQLLRIGINLNQISRVLNYIKANNINNNNFEMILANIYNELNGINSFINNLKLLSYGNDFKLLQEIKTKSQAIRKAFKRKKANADKINQ